MSKPTSAQINRTFYTTPRDGYKKGSIWIQRDEEKVLSSYLEDLGTSICIDGPTGTGKSSLAITTLKKRKVKYLLVQVTKNMSWEGFCLRLLHTKIKDNSSVDLGLDTGIDKGLPVFKLHLGINNTSNELNNLELEEKILDRMTDDMICEVLYKRKLSLLIDDFERASDEVLSNIGEMCKLLTESYISQNTKLIIVGTDDIYKRLTTFNKSLENRLKEVSLGTIDNKSDSWKFLINGFDKLKLKHPVYELNKGIKNITSDQVINCREGCYDAANGLLKSLNELGRAIVKTASSNSRLSLYEINKISKNTIEKNIRRFNKSYPAISNLIQENDVVRDVIKHLFNNKIGRIHNWHEIIESLAEDHDQNQIENAICQLVDIDFITRTGWDGEVLFVSNPTLAHTLGVVFTKPDKYRVPKAFLDRNNQLVLPLLGRTNIE